MFADTLESTEKRALLRLMAFLTVVDGKITQEEITYLHQISTYMEASAEGLFEEIAGKTIEDLCSTFERSQAKTIALIELINIAYADGDYSEPERVGVRKIADLLGTNEREVEKLERWVEQGLEWKVAGKRLVGIAS